MKSGALYWWIANTHDKGDKTKPQAHVDFLREWLPRAAIKLGTAPGVIVCNPMDRDSLAGLNGYAIETSEKIMPGNFWIGARENGNHNTNDRSGENDTEAEHAES